MGDAKAVRLHLTNIAGVGAVQLLKSLLPALERAPGYRIERIYLSGAGDFAYHTAAQRATTASRYRRRLPNSLSRFLECTVFARRFDGDTPLLVLGDLPLRSRSRQTVFVQTALVTHGANSGRGLGGLKYHISRWLFRYNARRVSAFIVQTEAMKASLSATYPGIADRVYVVSSPVPSWLLERSLRRTGRRESGLGLKLLYPAAAYPHKNHKLLSGIAERDAGQWPIAELALTIPIHENPKPEIPWIRCLGHLGPGAMIEQYESADALLFLSRAESFGFPLVEAMWVGLPVVCPDLPYARTLCGDGAIYFDPDSVDSLRQAVTELHRRLDAGDWPNWTEQLKPIPRSWDDVASEMLDLSTR